MELSRIRTYLFELPGEVGRERLGELPARTFVDALFARYVAAISPLFVVLACAATLAWLVLGGRRRARATDVSAAPAAISPTRRPSGSG